MSYGAWLEADLGGPEPLEVWSGWGYTSNVAGMWRRAMPYTDGLAGMDGMPAGRAATYLEAGVRRMAVDAPEYRALNPDNGWGDFDEQLGHLVALLAALRSAPAAVLRVTR